MSRRRRESAKTLAVVATAVAAADLATKAIFPTPDFAFHARPLWQLLVGATAVVAQSFLVPLLGSRLVAAAAAVAIGGAAGNLLSVAIWGAAPNPFFVSGLGPGVAFNLADVLVVGGFCLLGVSIVAHARAHPGRLRTRVREL